MTRFTERDLANGRAANANIDRMLANADTRAAIRRINEWANGRISATQWGETVTTSDHADPTAAAALLTTPIDDTALLAAWLRLSLQVERRLPGYIRSTAPTRLEAESTDVAFDAAAVFRPRSGNCAVCDVFCVGGEDPLHQVEGVGLCTTHKRGRYKPANRGRTVDNYVDSMRALHGKGLAS